jgi:hypothetical protein
MTSFALNLAKSGVLNTREANIINDVEIDYLRRLQLRSDNHVWCPLLEARNNKERQAVVTEIAGILGFAINHVSRVRYSTSPLELATAEVYRHCTLNWYMGIQPLLNEHLFSHQAQSLNNQARVLARAVSVTK